MKILWFPRLQFDIDTLHITTWREMCRELELNCGCTVKIAIAGKPNSNIIDRSHIRVFIIRKKVFRVLSFLFFGYVKFLYHYFKFRPQAVILDIFSIWFSIPFSILLPTRSLFIVDNRTPFYNSTSKDSTIKDRGMKIYTKLSYWYCKVFLDGMTVITDFYKQQVCQDFKFTSTNIGVWGSGVDIDRFSPQKFKDNFKPTFFRDKFVLMQHGEISYNRGLFETVEALAMLSRKDICLVLIGNAVTGSKAKDDILRLIKKLNLEKNVFILPPVPHAEIPKHISYCDCAIMAYPNIGYWNNNNPIKLIEYLAMGKVVICTDMWTFRNVIGNKKCGYFIKDNSYESIAKAINYCYENRKYIEEWGKEGIEIVKEGYTWNKQAKRLLDFVNALEKR
ncbi:MAG: glycosyltransferase [Planctomycetes bacterium]|nr:glycosyltransferase [Planctomycetota bacterium]